MKWLKTEIDPAEVRRISRTYEKDLLVSSVLLRRGITRPEEIGFFLEDDIEMLHDPFLFVEMEEAVDRINAAVESGESIYVYGDRDVDGITSTALLVKALAEMGGRVDWGLPHGDESYGLTPDLVESICDRGFTLLCAVDCGISSADEIEAARERGVDTIVVDHHNPQDVLPHAAALLNPKVEDSGYPFTGLSACGIVFKLIWALLFSRTPFYGKSVTLMNARPLKEAFVVEAVKLENLVEVDRVRENVVPGLLGWNDSRLAAFCAGEEILVFDRELQAAQLEKIFKGGVELPLQDLGPSVRDLDPDLDGKSLLEIRQRRRRLWYGERPPEEIDALADLFRAVVLRRDGLLEEKLVRCLDLVALSTLADVMPLKDENRILVRHGLRQINSAVREPLRELLHQKGLMRRSITSTDVAWQVSPAINAAGRMGEPEKGVELFLAETEEEIARLAAHIIDLNKKRRKTEEDIWGSVMSDARRFYDEAGGKFVMVSGERIERGITGLLANRLLASFKVPAVVVSEMAEKATGSLRCPKGFDVPGFFAGFGDFFTDYGGHDCAAGFTMALERLPEFGEKLGEIVARLGPVEAEEKSLAIDAEVPAAYLTPQLWSVVELFSPYGEANPPLLFLTRGMRIESAEVFGRKASVHLKMLLGAGSHKWPAIVWNGSERWNRDFTLFDRVDVVYKLRKSSFNNAETLEMIVVDVRK